MVLLVRLCEIIILGTNVICNCACVYNASAYVHMCMCLCVCVCVCVCACVCMCVHVSFMYVNLCACSDVFLGQRLLVFSPYCGVLDSPLDHASQGV